MYMYDMFFFSNTKEISYTARVLVVKFKWFPSVIRLLVRLCWNSKLYFKHYGISRRKIGMDYSYFALLQKYLETN